MSGCGYLRKPTSSTVPFASADPDGVADAKRLFDGDQQGAYEVSNGIAGGKATASPPTPNPASTEYAGNPNSSPPCEPG